MLFCNLRQSIFVMPSFSIAAAISPAPPTMRSVNFSNYREDQPRKNPTKNENPKRNVARADESISQFSPDAYRVRSPVHPEQSYYMTLADRLM